VRMMPNAMRRFACRVSDLLSAYTSGGQETIFYFCTQDLRLQFSRERVKMLAAWDD
jgi:hypothetical protein